MHLLPSTPRPFCSVNVYRLDTFVLMIGLCSSLLKRKKNTTTLSSWDFPAKIKQKQTDRKHRKLYLLRWTEMESVQYWICTKQVFLQGMMVLNIPPIKSGHTQKRVLSNDLWMAYLYKVMWDQKPHDCNILTTVNCGSVHSVDNITAIIAESWHRWTNSLNITILFHIHFFFFFAWGTSSSGSVFFLLRIMAFWIPLPRRHFC